MESLKFINTNEGEKEEEKDKADRTNRKLITEW